ncbi:MAG: hypothetical protein HC837_19785 [Chloroflexaceae bacterium]|nr:hypothetical protein [Chloroflexaceae bacterium]
MSQGHFAIATRVFLTPTQRQRLDELVRNHDIAIDELLTELLASFLDHLPEGQAETMPAAEDASDILAAELQQRRSELRRLRARAMAHGAAAPAWLTRYIAELEQEIARLEAQAPS